MDKALLKTLLNYLLSQVKKYQATPPSQDLRERSAGVFEQETARIKEPFILNNALRDEIYRLLDVAAAADPKFNLWGAHSHRYQLNPPLPEESLRKLEQRFSILLPEDYFWFMSQVGNGGAGPHGLLSLHPEEEEVVEHDQYLYDSAKEPFIVSEYTQEGWDNLLAENLRTDMPILGGMIPIESQGCTLVTALALVDGGRILYLDTNATWQPFFPTSVPGSFIGWYMNWLREFAAGYDTSFYGRYMPGSPEELFSAYEGADEDSRVNILFSLKKTRPENEPQKKELRITPHIVDELSKIIHSDRHLRCRQQALSTVAHLETEGWEKLFQRYMLEEDTSASCLSVLYMKFSHIPKGFDQIDGWYSTLMAAIPVCRSLEEKGALSELDWCFSLLAKCRQSSPEQIFPLIGERDIFDMLFAFNHEDGSLYSQYWKLFLRSATGVIREFPHSGKSLPDVKRLYRALNKTTHLRLTTRDESGDLGEEACKEMMPSLKALQADFVAHPPEKDSSLDWSLEKLILLLEPYQAPQNV